MLFFLFRGRLIADCEHSNGTLCTSARCPLLLSLLAQFWKLVWQQSGASRLTPTYQLSAPLLPVDCSCPLHLIAGQWVEQRSHYIITLTCTVGGTGWCGEQMKFQTIQDKRKINAIRFNPLVEKRENTWKSWPSQIVCSQSENRTQIKAISAAESQRNPEWKTYRNSWPNFIQINDLSQPNPTRHSQPSRVAFVKVAPCLPFDRERNSQG